MTSIDSFLQRLRPMLEALGVPEQTALHSLLWLLFFGVVALLLLVLFFRGALRRDAVVPPKDVPSDTAATEEERSEEPPSLEDESPPAIEPAPPAAPPEAAPDTEESESAPPPVPVEEEAEKETVSLFERMRAGLAKTQQGLVGRMDQLLRGRKQIDEELLEDLEEILVTADLGVATTQRLISALEDRLDRGVLNDGAQLRAALKEEILACLDRDTALPVLPAGEPRIILVTGVNGVGKTTTIGKLASRYVGEGQKVLLGAGDTFRAAAAEQLGIWAERTQCELVRHAEGADPGAVAYDAVKAASARKVDTLLLDTAGRLHNKAHLMEELKKVRRVIAREVPGAPHLTLLVLDATTGQNALSQARLFSEAVDVDGIVLTKLDGTAKGGVVIAIAAELDLPVYYIGIGEGVNDLRPFEPKLFVDALFESE